jgi:hypothetical protein
MGAEMKVVRAAALAILAVWPATAKAQQPTREQCEVVATAMQPMIGAVTGVDKKISAIDWGLVSRATSGQFRASSEAARIAQANLADSLRRYLIAIQDVTYQAQLCAR